MLKDSELIRYSRHLLLDDLGAHGQAKLKKAKVLIIGMGGLGSPASLYLAAAGVGSLTICDFDSLELSNLQRQIAYQSDEIGSAKVTLMQQRLKKLNPEISVRCIANKMEEPQFNLELLLADLVLDCTDNMPTRQLINRVCFNGKVPLIVGAAIRFEGHLSFFDHKDPDAACYHCYAPSSVDPQLNCSNSGVLGAVVGVMGSLQALEAIKIIVGIESTVKNKLKLFDGKTLQWQSFTINKDPNCQVCGKK
ncbi:MAG: molybdopterin-synthase adenylyltransferase MoeB [Psychromonas sp.]|nr:molybdopterin-synthase adenylyltransferase MoeB [Psychromonas sp.]